MHQPNSISVCGGSIASSTKTICILGLFAGDLTQTNNKLEELSNELAKALQVIAPNIEVRYVNILDREHNPDGTFAHFAFILSARKI